VTVVLAAVALLLFLWPFLREPRPALARAWVELLLAWTLAVAGLWAVSRRRDPSGPGERDG